MGPNMSSLELHHLSKK